MGYSVLGRGDLSHDILIAFDAAHKDTGELRDFGFWTGVENASFVVDGQPRTFVAGGSIVGMDKVTASKGLTVESQRLTLSALQVDVMDMLRGYEARLAPCRVYVARRDPVGNQLLGIDRVFKGFLNTVKVTSGQTDGHAFVRAALVGSEYLLTKGLSLKKSHAAQQNRQSDQFMKYATTTGKEPVYWGTRAYEPPAPSPFLPGGGGSGSGGGGNPWDHG